MAAGFYSFTIEQGATFNRVVTWKDANGAAINLTGFTATMVIKDKNAVTIATPTLTLGGAAGTIQIVLTAAVTAALTPVSGQPHRYDLLLTAGDGTKTRLLEGNVGIDARVS